MRKLNDDTGAVPLLLFIVTIVSCGALYTLFFVEVGFPALRGMIPESEAKTFILMCMYAVPLFILIVGVIALMKEGLKRKYVEGGLR